MLLQRLKQQNWPEFRTKAQQRLQNKLFSYGINLPASRQASSQVLKIAGSWHTPVITLDINDRQQQKSVTPWLQQYPDAIVMVSDWSTVQLQKLPAIWHQHPLYLLPPELVHRFQITSLPVLLTPESQNSWRVTTAAVSPFSALDALSWARSLISKVATACSCAGNHR